jgi:DNA-directed RNA polymerase specialized sigma24 family protein
MAAPPPGDTGARLRQGRGTAAGGGTADSFVDPRIMAALLRLPVRQRQVVALRLLLDLDTTRTAEVLGITPNTVMAHMARALAALRTDLMPERQQEGPS